jgi:L-amino acid N-acyltransferase YncA
MKPVIRLAAALDCEQISAVYAPYVLNTVISFETEPPGPDEFRRRVSDTLEFLPWLVCERNGQVLGYSYADKYRARAAYQWSASVSVYVDSTVHRAGIGRALYASLFRILDLQGLYNLYAGITLPNESSVGLHRSCGFHQIGLERSVGYKLGAWHDVSMWHLPLRPCLPAPEPPIPLAAVVEQDSWPEAISAGLQFIRL